MVVFVSLTLRFEATLNAKQDEQGLLKEKIIDRDERFNACAVNRP